jgi:hypothetical protein
MRIVSIIRQAVSRVTEIEQFVHASNFLNNSVSDRIQYPAAYLVRPVNITPLVVGSGHLIERVRCQMLFVDNQGKLLDHPDAQEHLDVKIEAMRKACLRFFKALQEDEQTGTLNVTTIRDTTNFFNAGLCGIVAEFTIELRMENPYPCPDEIPEPSQPYVVDGYIDPNYFES